MTDDLSRLLGDAADAEAARFDRDHPDDDLLLYKRAIAPRRTFRRTAEASGVAAIAASLAVGVVAVDAVVADRRDTAPATSTSPKPSASPSLTEVTETVEDEEAAAASWRVSGRPLDTFFVPAGPDEAVFAGADIAADAVGPCRVLDALARFEAIGGSDPVSAAKGPGSSSHLGGFHGLADVGVYEAEFARRADASAYLALIVEAGQSCREAVGAHATVSVEDDVVLASVPGGGARVDIALASRDPWRLWVHVHHGRVLTVIAEPGAADEAAPVITSYFTAWDR